MWEYYMLVNMYENDGGVTAMTLKGDLEWVREKEIGLFGEGCLQKSKCHYITIKLTFYYTSSVKIGN